MTARKAVAISFAAAAVAALAGVLAVAALVHDAAGASEELRLQGRQIAVGVGLGLAALLAMLWAFVDRALLRPLSAMARDAETLAQSRQTDRPLKVPAFHRLGAVPRAFAGLVEAMQASRREVARAVDAARAQVAEQKSWLEVILLDLAEGVVVCNANHQVLLYNQSAVRMLGGRENIGLGRPLFGVLTREPVLHTHDLLAHSHSAEGAGPDRSAPFVCATVDARVMLQGRMALIHDHGGASKGYVLTLTDISNQVATLSKSDAVRRAVTREMRGPIAALRAAAETVSAFPTMEPGQRVAFDQAILKEATALAERIEALAAEYRGHALGRWPMADIHSLDLFNILARHAQERQCVAVTPVGMPLWLQGDSHTLLLTLERLVGLLHGHTGAATFDAEALLGDRRVYVDLSWEGEPVPSHLLDLWLEEALDGALERLTLREVLDRHGSELWSLPSRQGRSLLRVPMLAPSRPQFQESEERLPARPEFYDFGLMHEYSVAGELGERRLSELTYVVFDTETTGLRPTEGDEIISIAGVRVVRGRILSGETFERLVDPQRQIPPESIRFHHITDDMVHGKPPIQVVLPQFAGFVGDAIMVAHNAAFDIKFLRMKEAPTGVVLRNPVLDTLILSILLDGAQAEHSLDAVAERLGIHVKDRHTALGDAMATAEILVRMIDRLEAQGIGTLGQAMTQSNMAAEIRQREAVF